MLDKQYVETIRKALQSLDDTIEDLYGVKHLLNDSQVVDMLENARDLLAVDDEHN